MKYRKNPKNGDEISILAFGCMRFPKDEEEAGRQIDRAIAQGVNYFDTAYIYPNSEAVLGRVLERNGKREQIKLATKLPTYFVKKYADLDKIFNTQLERLKTAYLDYYLIHMLMDVNDWQRLTKLGIQEWIAEKKASGQIRNIGFSYHGGLAEFKKLIDIYPWEFCMLQYNYYDENHQAGKAGLLYAAEKGLPVMIMEPLRGGRLVHKLPEEAKKIWQEASVERSAAGWGLRWVWNHPQVLTVLSGMNTLPMLEENLETAAQGDADSLSPQELELFDRVKAVLEAKTYVPCTGCNYCMPCPKNVDIPLCFSSYNDMASESKLKTRFYYIIRANNGYASQCVKCGKCEKHCPQQIKIREELARTAKVMENFAFKPMRFFVKKFMRLK